MKAIKDLTKGQLVSRFELLQKRMSKLTDEFIESNLGHLRPSDMRLRPECKLSCKYVKLLDEAQTLRIEAELRYGPGLLTVSQLKRR